MTSIREGIYLLDFVAGDGISTSHTLIADVGEGLDTYVIGELPSAEELKGSVQDKLRSHRELTDVHATIIHGTIGPPTAPTSPSAR